MAVAAHRRTSIHDFTPRALAMCAIGLLSVVLPTLAAGESAKASVVVNAEFSSRTSLKVSAQVLTFEVVNPAQAATASVEFSAGARTLTRGDVVLSFEMLRAIEGPDGCPDVEAALTLAGEGQGAMSRGALAEPQVARRWTGSGLRTGRLVFALRAGAAGTYAVPMRFTLIAP